MDNGETGNRCMSGQGKVRDYFRAGKGREQQMEEKTEGCWWLHGQWQETEAE